MVKAAQIYLDDEYMFFFTGIKVTEIKVTLNISKQRFKIVGL